MRDNIKDDTRDYMRDITGDDTRYFTIDYIRDYTRDALVQDCNRYYKREYTRA